MRRVSGTVIGRWANLPHPSGLEIGARVRKRRRKDEAWSMKRREDY